MFALVSDITSAPTLALDGIRFGLVIALGAVGLTLVFSTCETVNFAHGDMVTAGAVIAWWLTTHYHYSLYTAGLVAAVFGVILGLSMEVTIWRPLRRRSTSSVAVLIVSIGLALLIRFTILFLIGGGSYTYPYFTVQKPLTVGPVSLLPRDLVIGLTALAILTTFATWLQRSRQGKELRAMADELDLAHVAGVSIKKRLLLVWGLAGGLAAIAGVLIGVDEQISYLMGSNLLLLMFASATLGGLGSPYGAMVGGLCIGVVTQLSTLVIPPELKYVLPMAVLIAVILIRPQGVLGRATRVA